MFGFGKNKRKTRGVFSKLQINTDSPSTEDLGNQASDHLKKAGEELAAAANSAKDAVSDAVHQASDALTSAKDTAATKLSSAGDAISDAASHAKEALADAASSTKELVSETVAEVKEDLSDAKSSISEAASSVASKATDLGSELKSDVTKAATGVASAISASPQSTQENPMSHASPKLHNAMWPGLVGKGTDEGQEPPISLERMLELTANAEVGGKKFDGIDYFLFHPHTDPDASEDELKKIADQIAAKDLTVGSLVAPIWPGTVGDSSMGDAEQRGKFITAVEKACRIAKIFNEHGVRQYGVIRIDSADSPENWSKDPEANTRKIAVTFREAAKVAADNGERLAAEGEICWAGMHSWKDMLNLLEEVGMPESLGFQADLAHTYLYLMGYNAPENALLQDGYSDDEFWAAYEKMTDALRPWTIDFHVAQNDGEVHGSGSHDKTGKHCPADDPNGKLDIVKCSSYWLKDAPSRGIKHICWDGCMFPNATLETQQTWNTILDTMLKVRDEAGW